ncbi:fibroblast growth factor 1-like [Anthonomus grandis grandis]|uniref:fibroblast growth factor 1-like n=1 Tax=Anthonomus grandis grandis TaxID=2921223 RepID=UPI002165E1D6|nr:fibroblast growth factor 1-like [Anthonomus grandis grandis]
MSAFGKYSSSPNQQDSDSSSDSDGDSADEQDFSKVNATRDSLHNREKRNVSWCDNVQKITPSAPPMSTFPMVRRVVWPPPSTSQPSFRNAYVDPRNFPLGNPYMGSKMQLYCRSGWFLAVYPDGKVRGSRDENDPYTYLERESGGLPPEHVKFRGLTTNLYVAMHKKGRLYGERDPNSPATVFIESFHGSYNNYLSRQYAHLGWYMGIKKSGKFKKGSKTKFGQRAIKFLPRRTRFE